METTPASGAQPSEAAPEADQPGLSQLRAAVANRARRHLPSGSQLRQDGLAGLNVAISSVPDGMASGILAGVNPIYGLYAIMVGPAVGGIFSSTALMVITTTSAASLAAGQALIDLPSAEREGALFVMAIVIGVLQIGFGLLRLGRLTRFVSYSVMTGFLIGIAALTILSQIPTITGYEASGSNTVIKALDVLAHLGHVNLLALAMAALTLALALTLPRTRLGNLGTLVAIIIPSAVVALLHLGSVRVVRDVGAIPHGIPLPAVPSLSSLSPDVLTGALAVAVIILVQGAAVSQSVPNPDGTRRSMSRDFIGEGAANIATGFFRGIPVGGSLSTTALNVVSGARTRWAAIFAGLWVALLVILLPGLVSYVAMPALGALLILAAASAIKPADALSVWHTGWSSRLAGGTTLVATLSLPIQVAVGIGVLLSAFLYLNQSSADLSVVELIERPDGRIEERKAPKALSSDQVTVLDVYGSLSYAGAGLLDRLLPAPEGARSPVVVLRLRGHTTVGATLVQALSSYADRIEAMGGRLYLSGISEATHDKLVRTGKLHLSGPMLVYEATPIVGQSTRQALADARGWLVGRGTEGAHDRR
jgi:SulP family sulfate permease